MKFYFSSYIILSVLHDIELQSVSCGMSYLMPNLKPHRITNPERHIGMPKVYPTSFSDCNNNWMVLGEQAKIIKMIANNVGLYNCTLSYQWDKNSLNLYGSPVKLFPVMKKWTHLYPHVKSDLCLLVQRIPPRRYRIWESFSDTMWICTTVVLICFGITIHMFFLRPAALYVFGTLITGGFPDKGLPIQNLLLLMLSAVGVLLLSAFSGCYTGYLSIYKEEKQINTLKEVVEHVSTLYMDEIVQKRYENVSFLSYDLLGKVLKEGVPYSKSTHLDMYIDKLYKVSRSSSTAIDVQSSLFDSLLAYNSSLLLSDGTPRLHLVRECLSSPQFNAFPVRRDWPFASKFNEKLMRLVNMGIVEKLTRDTITDWWKVGILQTSRFSSRILKTTANDPIPLGIEAFLDPLVLLASGLALASLAYVYEKMKFHSIQLSER